MKWGAGLQATKALCFKVPKLPATPDGGAALHPGLGECYSGLQTEDPHHVLALLAGSSTSSQDEATGVLSPSCSLGPRVPHAAPLAVGVVHSLQQEAVTEAAVQAAGQCNASRSVTAKTTPPLLPQQVRHQAA